MAQFLDEFPVQLFIILFRCFVVFIAPVAGILLWIRVVVMVTSYSCGRRALVASSCGHGGIFVEKGALLIASLSTFGSLC